MKNSNWKEIILKEVAEKIAMGPFGSNIKVETFVSDGIPVISGQHLKGIKLFDGDYSFVTEEHANRLKNSLVYRGDVIFTHAGNIGQVAYIPEDSKYEKYVISQRQFYLRCDRQRLDPVFITYFFKSRYGQYKLLANANQVGVPSISQPSSYLKSLSLRLPLIDEQKEIAAVLSSLDDKIELLRRQNETLEKIAQGIFKEWFVNFKIDGKKLRLKNGVPEGWRVGFLGEFIKESISGEWGKENIEDDFTKKVTCIRGTDISDIRFGNMSRGPERFIKDIKFQRCKIVDGDIVIEISGGTEGQSTGRAVYINNEIIKRFKNPLVCVNFCRVLRPIKISYSYFIYLLLDSLYKKGVFFNLENGTTGIKNLDIKSLLNKFDLILPPSDTVELFNAAIEANFEKIQVNNHQIQTLSRLRDTLLPKLMSGEIKTGGL